MRIQEILLDPKDVDSGRIPRTIECELTEDLTGKCAPGDLVTVNGIVKALSAETTGAGRSNKDKCTFVLYINVSSIQGMVSNEEESTKPMNNPKNFEFSAKDLESFKAINEEDNAFR